LTQAISFYQPMSVASTQMEQELWQNELLTVAEIAAYLRVSRVTVWRWCQQGVIPASRVGRNWRIRRDDFLQLLGWAPPMVKRPISPGSDSEEIGEALPLLAMIEEIQ
jgi:excisionase family DNA binding protein